MLSVLSMLSILQNVMFGEVLLLYPSAHARAHSKKPTIVIRTCHDVSVVFKWGNKMMRPDDFMMCF